MSLYYIISYRKKVIERNLQIIHPKESIDFIHSQTKKYYKQLSKLILDSIWAFRASPIEIFPKVKFKNIELFDEIYQKGENATILISHIGNWEIFCQWAPLFIPNLNVVILYTPLKNSKLNELMLRYRQRFGANLVSTKSTLELFRIQKTKKICINLFAIDQNPGDPYHQYWMPFFGEEVPVISGAEKFAKSQSQDVYFLKVNLENETYHLELVKIQSQSTIEYDTTHQQIRLLEENILQDSSQWLLSHNRFKFKK